LRVAGMTGKTERMIRFEDVQDLPQVRLVRGKGICNAFPRHVHRSFSIGIIERGRRSVAGRDGTVHGREGDVFVVGPGEPHRCIADNHDYRIVCIETDYLSRLLRGIDGGSEDFPRFAPLAVTDATLYAWVESFADMAGRTGCAREKESALSAILARLLSIHACTLPDSKPCRYARAAVRRTRAYVAERYRDSIKLGDLADVARLSPFHFSRIFSHEVGVPPHAFHIQLRVDKARLQMLEGVPIASAALDAGFADQSHFTRFFRRIVGVTPGDYVCGNRPAARTGKGPPRRS
jgi:AraC-like DNA-binding protein